MYFSPEADAIGRDSAVGGAVGNEETNPIKRTMPTAPNRIPARRMVALEGHAFLSGARRPNCAEGHHHGASAHPTAIPVTPCNQVQARRAPPSASHCQFAPSLWVTQGRSKAHQRPNLMCEMNRDAWRPPISPPSKMSRTTTAIVALAAEATASRSNASTPDSGMGSFSRDMAIIAIPPMASGSFTLTS